jgi:alkylation response protein AidB-like acyl-CoA dehydrogenase
MRFAPTDEQRHFARSLHDLLGDVGTPSAARAVSAGDVDSGRAVWKRLADVGLPALLVPEGLGGLGADATDVAVAFEEVGHHAAPGPLVEASVVTPVLLAGLVAHAPELTERLPQVAEGGHVVTVAHPLCPRVVGAPWADEVLFVRGEELRRLRPETLRAQRSVDPARAVATVADPAAGDLLADGPEVAAAGAAAAEAGTLAVCAQLLGAARMLLETAVEYAGQRAQFGRRIGEFQAVKHQLADVAVAVDFARPLVHGAAVALASASPHAARDVSAAKVAAGAAADRAARTALQVHGAVGYTHEHDLSVWLLMVRALVHAWGTPGHHRDRILRALQSGSVGGS